MDVLLSSLCISYWLHSSHSHQQICFTSTRLCHYLWVISCGIIISIRAQCLLSSFKYKFFFYCQAIKYVLFTESCNKMWNSTVCTQQQDKKKKSCNIQIIAWSFLMYSFFENLTTMQSYMYAHIYIYMLITVSNLSKNLWKNQEIMIIFFFFFTICPATLEVIQNVKVLIFSYLVMLEFPPTEGKETPAFWTWKFNTLNTISGISLFVMKYNER